jgi:hypothetical protein
MKYYRLLDDMLLPNRWNLSAIQEIDNWVIARPPMLALDDPLRDKVLKIRLRNTGNALDFSFAGYAGVPVISFKALQALSGLDGFTALVAKVEGFVQETSYYALHVWDVADCVDEKLSRFEKFQVDDPVRPDLAGQYSAFFDLVVEPDRAEGKHLFRLTGSGNEIIVSEEVKIRLEAAGAVGAVFRSVDRR